MKFEPLLNSPKVGALGTIEFVGRITGGKGVEPRHHFRQYPHFGLTVITSGYGEFLTAVSPSTAILRGDAIITLPGNPHWFGPQDGATWDEIFVTFHGPQFDLMLAHGLLDPSQLIRQGIPHASILKLLAQPADIAVTGLAQILVQSPIASRPEHPWLEAADSKLIDLTPPLKTVPEIAEDLGIPANTFRRVFQASRGLAPQAYRNQRRLELAIEMLQRTSLTITEISNQLSYADPFAFSKAFKNGTGMSPRDFRRAKDHSCHHETCPTSPLTATTSSTN